MCWECPAISVCARAMQVTYLASGAPTALRGAGLIQRLAAYDHGDLPCPAYDPANDPATGYRHGAALPGYSLAIADGLAALLATGGFPLLLGGDCSISLGSTLALRRHGRYGLLFIDGHTDYYELVHPFEQTAAGADLGLVLGDGPLALVDIEGRRPYVQAGDAVAFGYRDDRDTATYHFDAFRRAECMKLGWSDVCAVGAAAVMRAALAFLQRAELDGFWIHLDVDVLDPRWMPAVDSPDPGGMTPDDLISALRLALASPHAVGMQLTIYDPELDPGGDCAALLVDILGQAFDVVTPG